MKYIFKTLSLAMLLVITSNVQAVTINEGWESFDPELGYGVAEYTVSNNSGSAIYAFVVGNNDATNVWSNNNGWNSTTIDAFEWNDAETNINYLGAIDNPVFTSSLGKFEDLFTGYSQALMYSFNYFNQKGLNANPDAQPIASGSTVGGFFFTTEELASPFIAIDINGNIVGSGEAINAVPVPAAIWLFGSGLLGLVGIARRKV